MNGIPQLKCKNSVSLHFLAFNFNFIGRQSIIIESIVPFYFLKNLHLTTHQPITGIKNHFHIRMLGIRCAKLPTASLLLSMKIKFRLFQYRQTFALVPQANCHFTLETIFLLGRCREDNWHRLIHLHPIFRQCFQMLHLNIQKEKFPFYWI